MANQDNDWLVPDEVLRSEFARNAVSNVSPSICSPVANGHYKGVLISSNEKYVAHLSEATGNVFIHNAADLKFSSSVDPHLVQSVEIIYRGKTGYVRPFDKALELRQIAGFVNMEKAKEYAAGHFKTDTEKRKFFIEVQKEIDKASPEKKAALLIDHEDASRKRFYRATENLDNETKRVSQGCQSQKQDVFNKWVEKHRDDAYNKAESEYEKALNEWVGINALVRNNPLAAQRRMEKAQTEYKQQIVRIFGWDDYQKNGFDRPMGSGTTDVAFLDAQRTYGHAKMEFDNYVSDSYFKTRRAEKGKNAEVHKEPNISRSRTTETELER
jgi:hypothetical protein